MVRIARHETLALGGGAAGARPRRLLHAHVWARVEVAGWGERRDLHLHLVADPGEVPAWRPADLKGRPLRRAPAGGEPPLPDGVEASLERYLETWTAVLWRSPELGIVSEPGEPVEAFRSRLLSLARPALGRRLDELRAAAPPALPWRRRAAAEELRRRREELAAALHRIAEGIERAEVRLGKAGALRAEVGWLLAPDDGVPGEPRPARDPMVRGPVRGGEIP